ncbi:hypothetical protein FCH28_03040 [Streptomyces piniterrae]|uniref:Uncharacterized protein n=1 Tax=Streptomyces piniterrae TaxID=2571125 RepID=A0A4U0NWK9_9ACTN|nr:hypothetical protein FCH28_03040 [Streptomyces piniterrae]
MRFEQTTAASDMGMTSGDSRADRTLPWQRGKKGVRQSGHGSDALAAPSDGRSHPDLIRRCRLHPPRLLLLDRAVQVAHTVAGVENCPTR